MKTVLLTFKPGSMVPQLIEETGLVRAWSQYTPTPMVFTVPALVIVRLLNAANTDGPSKLRLKVYRISATAAPTMMPSFLSKD
jgi:hypothetical protein